MIHAVLGLRGRSHARIRYGRGLGQRSQSSACVHTLRVAERELLAALRADPDDEDAWTVLGDLLTTAGDPRGEWIALERRLALPASAEQADESLRPLERQVLEHRVAELAEDAKRWLGELGEWPYLTPRWRRGFVVEATLHRPQAKQLAILLELPVGALLHALTIHRVRTLDRIVDVLASAAADQRALVRRVVLAQPVSSRLAPLASLAGLRELSSSGSVTDLATLAELPELERLELSRTAFDLAALGSGFSRLHTLIVSAHPSPANTRLEPLASLAALRELDLGEAAWDRVDPLARLDQLEVLHLRSTDVFDLRPLAGLERLRVLDLRGCPVADLEPLAGLGSLEQLRLGWTRVRELRSLRGLERLRSLDIAGTAVRDLDPIVDLPSLERIDVQGSDVRDVRRLIERGVQVLGRPQIASPTWRDLAESLLRDARQRGT